jgi:hypothetical protein
MTILELLAERRIAEAQRQGAFDGLHGSGQPLRLEPDEHVPPEWRASFHLLRQAGMSPDWIALGAEIERELAEVRRRKASSGNGPDACRLDQAAIAALNRKVDRYNSMVPHLSLQRSRLRLEP